MSKRFFCLCMSPAIDATVRLPSAPRGDGEIFKDVVEEENVGGKAVNVARWLAIRGAKVACGGLLGEDNDKPFEKELAKYSIEDRFVRVAGATRRNEMIVWPGGSVKLNRSAFHSLKSLEGIDVLEGAISQSHNSTVPQSHNFIAILSGSLPPALPKTFYADAVSRLKSLGMTVVLDASGEAMRLAIDSKPDLIKPNAEECEPRTGVVPKTPDEFRKATALLREKAAHVIISDGGSGAWFDGEFVAAPKVDVVDTTAAGDTLLAEYCWRMWGEGNGERGMGNGEWAVAAGSAACTMPGGAPPDEGKVKELKESIVEGGAL